MYWQQQIKMLLMKMYSVNIEQLMHSVIYLH